MRVGLMRAYFRVCQVKTQSLNAAGICSYGEHAASVTNDAMFAAGHGAMTAWNVTEFGPKAIAKRTAKKAGLAVLSDLGKQPKNKPLEGGTNEK